MTETFGFLLSDTARVLRQRFDERARQHGATRAQWKALIGISRHEGINQGGLAEWLEVEPITLCRMVDRMEDAGLVERRRDPKDRRAWQLFLTDRAHPILEQLRATAEELTAQALNGIPESEVAGMSRLLDRIRGNLAVTSETTEAAHG
jgi:DNA-binding MarR family transcriptional regulator